MICQIVKVKPGIFGFAGPTRFPRNLQHKEVINANYNGVFRQHAR